MTITDEVKVMSNEELGWALSVVSQEIAARKELAEIPAKIEALNRDYLAATGVTEGNEWVQPLGAHDAYPEGWVLLHNGKEWRSLIPANVWEPGVSAWREVVPEPAPTPQPDPNVPVTPVTPGGAGVAAWIQPTGGHDSYKKGNTVSHKGKVWTSSADGNVWEPGVYGWVAD